MGRFILLTAVAARALAACARQSGYRPLVADLFADLDTQGFAEAFERVPGSLKHGLTAAALLPALERLAAGRDPLGVVVGPGFEDRPDLMRAIAAHHQLIGNTPDTVARLKDPFQFAQLCRTADISHPEIRRDRPDGADWLCKRDGGSGGVHIVAARHAAPRHGRYYQRRVPGTAISAAFLADGRNIRVLGFSRQWVAPVLRRRFRYGGAVRPAALAQPLADHLSAATARLAALVGLRGLNSADFLVRDDGFDLLEINPRPGATLDIFADAAGALFQMHLDASAGALPQTALNLPPAAGAAFVYAPRDIVVPANFAWPDWTADRAAHGTTIVHADPVCSVVTAAEDAGTAEHLLRLRTTELLRALHAPKPDRTVP
jgi:predicted ATP-grasp superfamily ATP-dependent carboligase